MFLQEINNYRPRSLSPFSNRSNEEEDVQRQIESKEMQMRKMKARRFGREPKPVQIPQIKLTVEEQKKQVNFDFPEEVISGFFFPKNLNS